MDNLFFQVFLSAEFMRNTLRFATPLILAAMGGVVNERSGVLNLSVDGMMLVGAFAGFTAAFYTGNPVAGLLVAMLICTLMGAIHAYFTVSLSLNQVIVAIALNTFALGMTSSLLRTLFGMDTSALRSAGFGVIPWPFGLSRVPIIGEIFFTQTIFTYIALLAIPLVWWVFYRTEWGLSLRACGEYPKAAETMGVSVGRVRYLALMFSGFMSGIAGAALSISGLNTFIDNMTAGRGFIAFACILFGRFNPLGAAGGALMFGLATGAQLRLQALGTPIPYQLPIMFPYVLIIVLLGVLGTGAVPAAWGNPYFPDEE